MNFKKNISLVVLFFLFFLIGCNKQSNFDKALSYQNDAEYDKAIEFYNTAIEKGERVAESEKNIGDIFFVDRKYDYAFVCYKRSIESDPNVALETVMKYISYNDVHVRELVGDLFFDINGKKANEKINESLANILHSGDQYKILDALFVMSRMEGKCVPILNDIIKLLDSNNIIKQKVLEILPNFAKDINNEDFDKILDLLSQNDEIIKTATIECLGNMNEQGKRALETLFNMSVKEPRYKEQIFSAIDKIGRPEQKQMGGLCSLLKDKPKDVKMLFLNVFDKNSGGANGYVPYLMCFLNDEDSEIKQLTRNILTKIGKASPECVPELIKLLEEKNEEIVSRAIYELGDLGKEASDAVEPLKKILETTTNKDIKKLAKDALNKIQ